MFGLIIDCCRLFLNPISRKKIKVANDVEVVLIHTKQSLEIVPDQVL